MLTSVAGPCLIGAVLLTLVMAGVWAVALRIRNASIVDIAWSANFSLLAVLFAAALPGYPPRRLLIAAMTLLWSLRLALYLYRRVLGHHPVEDGRYVQLRREWAPRVDRRFFWHPNYFFEWLVWVAFFVFAAASPWGWVSAYCPALMLFFLFRVTGIPMTEAQALKSRGDDYRAYQRTTSVFVPWFPRA